MVDVLKPYVPDLDVPRVNAAFEHGWQAYRKAWQSNEPFSAVEAVPLMLGYLGVETAPPSVIDELLAVIVDPPAERRPPLTPHIAETLAALKDAGLRLCIICDVGLTPSTALRRWLDAHGVLQYFDHWSFSDEVGVFKPAPEIFRHALDGLSAAAGRAIEPARATHVGDLRRTDIAGAQAAGMTAVRYTGVADDPVSGGIAGDCDAEGDFVMADHADLPGLLGIGV